MDLIGLLTKINVAIWSIIIGAAMLSLGFKVWKSKISTEEQVQERNKHELIDEVKAWILIIAILGIVDILTTIAINMANGQVGGGLGALSFIATGTAVLWKGLSIGSKIAIGIKALKYNFATDEQSEEIAKKGLFTEVKTWIIIIGVLAAISVLLGIVQSMAM